MTDRNRRITRTVGAGAAAIALVGLTACGGEVPSVPSLPTGIPGVGDPRQAFGDAHQQALGLAALGGLGLEQGVGQQVKDLAPQVQAEGQQIDQRLRGMASAVGVSLPDQVSPETQAQMDDLRARTGAAFDQGWLQAAQTQVQQLNEQAAGLLNVPGVPADMKAQAQQQLSNLGALQAKLDEAAAAAGAATPGGEGGQAAGPEAGQGGEGGQAPAPEGGAGDAGAGGTASGQGGSGAEGSGAEGSGAEGSGQDGSGSSAAVDAGTGGQAASSDVVLPVALGGAGVLLLGAGLIRLRRSRA